MRAPATTSRRRLGPVACAWLVACSPGVSEPGQAAEAVEGLAPQASDDGDGSPGKGNGGSTAAGQGGSAAGTKTQPQGTPNDPGTTTTPPATTPTTPPGSTPTKPPESSDPATPAPNPADSGIIANGYIMIGRPDMTEPEAPVFSFGNSAIGATFSGTSLAVRMSDTGHDVWAAAIDGGAPVLVNTAVGDSNRLFSIAAPGTLAAGNHTVWLTKRTEFWQGGGANAVGYTTFLGFVLDDGASLGTPPTPRARRMIFSGDSTFTGYGAGAVMKNGYATPEERAQGLGYCGYLPENQNAQASVPALTAQKLSAEVHNISWSGMGTAFSVYDGNQSHLLPNVWLLAQPPKAAPRWDASKFVPDVVVLASGGADLCGGPGSGHLMVPDATSPDSCQGMKNFRASHQGFVDAYVAWLKLIRAQAPNALILGVLGSGASGGDINELGSAIQEALAVAADPNTAYYSYFQASDEDNPNKYQTYGQLAVGDKLWWGCNNHPSAAGADWLATRLAKFVAAKKGWALP